MMDNFKNQASGYDKLIDIKKLHSPPPTPYTTNPELTVLYSQQTVLRCIGYLFDMNLPAIPDMRSTCDNSITSYIYEQELGTNQTILNLAHEYLQARGIK
jgi:hypothetical protein